MYNIVNNWTNELEYVLPGEYCFPNYTAVYIQCWFDEHNTVSRTIRVFLRTFWQHRKELNTQCWYKRLNILQNAQSKLLLYTIIKMCIARIMNKYYISFILQWNSGRFCLPRLTRLRPIIMGTVVLYCHSS